MGYGGILLDMTVPSSQALMVEGSFLVNIRVGFNTTKLWRMDIQNDGRFGRIYVHLQLLEVKLILGLFGCSIFQDVYLGGGFIVFLNVHPDPWGCMIQSDWRRFFKWVEFNHHRFNDWPIDFSQSGHFGLAHQLGGCSGHLHVVHASVYAGKREAPGGHRVFCGNSGM